MNPSNPPPAKLFRAGSDKAGSARTWNYIPLDIQDTLHSTSTGIDIDATLTISKLKYTKKSRNAEPS